MDLEKTDVKDIPKEVLGVVVSKSLPSSAIINFPRTSKYFTFFNKEEYKAQYQLALDELRQLLSHAALGEWSKAEVIWSKDPLLLTLCGTVYHPNRAYQTGKEPLNIPTAMNPGRYEYNNKTAWQIAWMNAEYDIAGKMGACLTEEERLKQLLEIFPEGKLIKYNWDLNLFKKLLNDVFDAVIKDEMIIEKNLNKMSEATERKLYALYAYAALTKKCTQGLVCDPHIYAEALHIYEDEDKFKQFKNWHQRSFWYVRIGEYLASLLGTGYLRPHNRAFTNDKDLPELDSTLENKSDYFAFRRPVNSIPGFHFFIGPVGEIENGVWAGAGGQVGVNGYESEYKKFLTLIEQKQEQGLKLMQEYTHNNVELYDHLRKCAP